MITLPVTASDWVTDVLLVIIYGACILLALTTARLSIVLTRWDIEDRARQRKQEATEREARWPEYVIEEQP